MINAVVGQGGQKIESGLITPEELRETLKDIRRKKAAGSEDCRFD